MSVVNLCQIRRRHARIVARLQKKALVTHTVKQTAVPAPAKPPLMRTPFKIALGVIVMLFVFGVMADKKDASASSSSTASNQCAEGNLQCLGDKGVVAASVYCKNEVEKLAKHSVRWIDGTLELKFSHYRWRNKAHQEITYIGDKAEFQNGFGAYTRVVYECDLDTDNKTVLGVRVHEGRLDS
jgi:hypothetical protein